MSTEVTNRDGNVITVRTRPRPDGQYRRTPCLQRMTTHRTPRRPVEALPMAAAGTECECGEILADANDTAQCAECAYSAHQSTPNERDPAR